MAWPFFECIYTNEVNEYKAIRAVNKKLQMFIILSVTFEHILIKFIKNQKVIFFYGLAFCEFPDIMAIFPIFEGRSGQFETFLLSRFKRAPRLEVLFAVETGTGRQSSCRALLDKPLFKMADSSETSTWNSVLCWSS